ncbi:p-nitrophenyl phosphatase [Spathaspora passalidarum NRRL Y-27907]|uniref:4-nitrophenylphosphatase n=1 Tax=Spathaspora passalidarum (strain NRRL Y-27907 / 11-Y1) TaxID=619300 RepID=G3ATL1_SPAPN|nr:p-nitrophenyl phosphatase [Spathaspora passalidarum NRRL Y-27907]EGW30974.1 p-nitrophenyl phosphatase [Spathaspora passalidarum NRRL Y-27907]
MSLKITNKQQVTELLDQYDYFIFDCDGVLWLGDHLLPHIPETLQMLKDKGKTVIFVTNNSTKSRNDYLHKFEKLGISGITKDEVFGSSYASAVYIDKILQLPKDKKVWVLGEAGIEQELHELGYKTVGGTDPKLVEDGVKFKPDHPLIDKLDPEVGAVLCGLTFNVNYLKLSITLQYLLQENKSLPFIATNIDSTFPVKGKLLIGAGSIIETVAFASGRQPDAICGKPNQAMMNAIKADNPGLQANPKKGLMVGDRLNTDMKFGRDGGLDTLLVLTGIETEENVLALAQDVAPTYYANKLGDLYEF